MFAQVTELFVYKTHGIYHYRPSLCSCHHRYSLKLTNALHITRVLCYNQLQPLALVINLVNTSKLWDTVVFLIVLPSLLVQLYHLRPVVWVFLSHHV